MKLQEAQQHINRVAAALVTATGVPLGKAAETVGSWRLLADYVLACAEAEEARLAAEAVAAAAEVADDTSNDTTEPDNQYLAEAAEAT